MRKPSDKSRKKTKTYQPRPSANRRFQTLALGRLLGGLTRHAFQSRGLANSAITEHWQDIIGQELSKMTAPERIVYPMRSAGNGCLHLRVAHSAMALQIQHLTPVIMERINSYFGYPAVSRIKIIHAPLPKTVTGRQRQSRSGQKLNDDQERDLAETLEQIDDPELMKTLEKLGRAVIGHKKA